MLAKLLSSLNHLGNALAGLLRLRRKAKRDALFRAIHAGDVDEVTKAHHDLLLAFAVLLGTIAIAGCAARTTVVNQPMTPVRLIHEGTPGWWLSDCLYEATLLKLEEHTHCD